MNDLYTVNPQIDADYAAALDEAALIEAAIAALRVETAQADARVALDEPVEVTIVITSDDAVRALNRDYRGKDTTTDVLSFHLTDDDDPTPFVTDPDAPRYIGDIVIAYPQAERQAPEFQNSTRREVQELVIHGVFHLLGFDHEGPDEREVMRAREEAAHSLLDKA